MRPGSTTPQSRGKNSSLTPRSQATTPIAVTAMIEQTTIRARVDGPAAGVVVGAGENGVASAVIGGVMRCSSLGRYYRPQLPGSSIGAIEAPWAANIAWRG